MPRRNYYAILLACIPSTAIAEALITSGHLIVTMRLYRQSFVMLALLFLAGCGGSFPTAAVEGQVTVDGEPIPEGLISFTPLESDAGVASSAEITSGRYRAEDVPLGRVLVRFHAMRETGKTFEEFGQQLPETESIIPAKHMDGEEIQVESGQATRDFNLTSR